MFRHGAGESEKVQGPIFGMGSCGRVGGEQPFAADCMNVINTKIRSLKSSRSRPAKY